MRLGGNLVYGAKSTEAGGSISFEFLGVIRLYNGLGTKVSSWVMLFLGFVVDWVLIFGLQLRFEA